jgi:hypothetical protein
MKLYPYSKLKSENLGILLFSARALAILGVIMLLAGVVIALLGLSSGGGTQDLGNGMTMTTPSMVGPGIIGLVWGVTSGFILLAFSGICAAIVSCENKYTSNNV